MTSKLASLHAGLIARKGEAMPALSNPGFSYVDTARPAPVLTQVSAQTQAQVPAPTPAAAPIRDDSNDTKPTGLTPDARQAPPPPVTAKPIVRQSPPLNREKSTRPSLEAATTLRAQREPVRKTEEDKRLQPHKLTFRMTQDQRRRLRIAAAQRDKSLQQILSDALDNHLDGLCACSPEGCTCLARNETRQVNLQ